MDNFTAGFPALVLVLNLQGKLAENQKYKMQSTSQHRARLPINPGSLNERVPDPKKFFHLFYFHLLTI